MRVLVVEDERHVAKQISAKLSRAGYVVEVAHDGGEGLYMGENMPYDSVVLDLGLPIIDGLTVLRRWRSGGRRMPVLILTARGRRVMRQAPAEAAPVKRGLMTSQAIFKA